jgi:hypothetical protein
MIRTATTIALSMLTLAELPMSDILLRVKPCLCTREGRKICGATLVSIPVSKQKVHQTPNKGRRHVFLQGQRLTGRARPVGAPAMNASDTATSCSHKTNRRTVSVGQNSFTPPC